LSGLDFLYLSLFSTLCASYKIGIGTKEAGITIEQNKFANFYNQS